MNDTPSDVIHRPLGYAERLARRPLSDIDLAVIHCTELPDLDTARIYGERIHYPESQTGNSGHYYIDRNGRTECWVDVSRIAHHVRSHNARSIGIELVNSGRWPDWFASGAQKMTEPYPDAQIDALLTLLDRLLGDLPVLRYIAGHEDLDRGMVPATDLPDSQVRSKRDPGPMFPWARVIGACGLERLHELAPGENSP